MSLPLEQQQQQPPPMAITQQTYKSHTGSGSIGPVIAVLAVITILGVIAGMIGRLCAGRSILGHGHYDFEGWIERKCGSCIDGRIEPPPAAPPRNANSTSASVPTAISVDIPQETRQGEQSSRSTPET